MFPHVSPFQVEIWTIWRCLYIQNRYVFLQIHICHISTYNQHNYLHNLWQKRHKIVHTKQHWKHPPAVAVRQSRLPAASPQGFWMLLDAFGMDTSPTLGSWENHRLKMPILGGYVIVPWRVSHPFFQLIQPPSPASPRRWAVQLPPRLLRAAPPCGARLLGHNSCSFGMKTTLRWIKISVQKLQKWYFWVSAASFWEVQ